MQFNSNPSTRAISVVFLALSLAACSNGDSLNVNSTQAEAERAAASEHFNDMQYADVQPLGTPAADKSHPEEAEPAKDQAERQRAADHYGDSKWIVTKPAEGSAVDAATGTADAESK